VSSQKNLRILKPLFVGTQIMGVRYHEFRKDFSNGFLCPHKKPKDSKTIICEDTNNGEIDNMNLDRIFQMVFCVLTKNLRILKPLFVRTQIMGDR
jgi:hypothetical protein